MSNVFENLNKILEKSDIEDVSAESNGSFSELPDGYYLCEVKSAEVKETKENHDPMISFDFVTTDDGIDVALENNDVILKPIKKTKGRHIFINYVIKDETSLKRFVSDMLKFEEEPGVQLLEKEYFTNSEVLCDALDIIEGMKIYVLATTNENKNGEETHWKNLVSWTKAQKAGLPVD